MNCLRHQSISTVLRLNTVSPAIQQLRWKVREPVRKPKWLPRAPTKIYQVHQPPELAEDEVRQFDHLSRSYFSKLRSIRAYFHQSFYKPSLTAGGKSAEQIEQELLEDERLIADNENENRIMAQTREKRLQREHELISDELLTIDGQYKADEAQKIVEAMAVVAKETKRAPTYITPETLDRAIEEALANPVSYDYHIDKAGKLYVTEDRDLHPYALKPTALPETSSNVEEVALIDKQQELKFTAKKLY